MLLPVFFVYDFTDKVSGKGIACRCGINGFYRENALCAAFGVIAIHGTFFAEGEHNFAIRKFVNQSVQQSSAIRVFSKGSTRFFLKLQRLQFRSESDILLFERHLENLFIDG